MTEAEIQAGEVDPREAFRRLHARASTAAVGDNVVVNVGDLQAVLNVLGAPPAETKPPGGETIPPGGETPKA